MKAYLAKEFKLAVPPGMFLLTILGLLCVIPNYPAVVGYIYNIVCIFILFTIARDNRDLEFSAILPVSRRTVVWGKCIVVAVFEACTVAFSAIGAVIANVWVSPLGNLVGLDLNLTFFGVVLIAFAVYNIVLIPAFFRTGYKIFKPLVAASTAFIACYLAFELPIQLVPSWKAALDTLNPAYFGYQAILLGAGIALYGLSFWATVKLGVRNFERVSL